MGHGPSATLFFGCIWGEDFPEEIEELDWKELDKLQDEFGVEIGWHGCGDGYGVAMPYLYVRGLYVGPYTYEHAEVDPQLLDLNEIEREAAADKLLGFCDRIQITTDEAEGPAWFIAPFEG